MYGSGNYVEIIMMSFSNCGKPNMRRLRLGKVTEAECMRKQKQKTLNIDANEDDQ